MTRDEAYALLTEYNKEPFHLEHAETVEKTMMYFADKLGYGGTQAEMKRLMVEARQLSR